MLSRSASQIAGASSPEIFRALEKDPSSAGAHYGIAFLLLNKGRGDEAAVRMGEHLRAVEATLAIVEEEQETPDLHRIFHV